MAKSVDKLLRDAAGVTCVTKALSLLRDAEQHWQGYGEQEAVGHARHATSVALEVIEAMNESDIPKTA